MTKEIFEERLKTGVFPDIEIYEYYTEKCTGRCLDYPSFQNIINSPLQRFDMFGLDVLQFNKSVAFKKMIEFYQEKYK